MPLDRINFNLFITAVNISTNSMKRLFIKSSAIILEVYNCLPYNVFTSVDLIVFEREIKAGHNPGHILKIAFHGIYLYIPMKNNNLTCLRLS